MRFDRALESWDLALSASNKRPRTRETYLLAGTQLLDFLKDRNHSLEITEISRDDLRGYIGAVLMTRSDQTAKQRHSSLTILFRWLVTENEIEVNPMDAVEKPTVTEKPIPVVTGRQFELLVESCQERSFVNRRDEALMRFMWDTGARISEIIGLRVEDVDVHAGVWWVDGKGGKLRRVYFTEATAYAIDRYLRFREKHKMSSLPQLWIGERGCLTRNGVQQMLRRRADRLNLPSISPHQFRHAFADRWLSVGGAEGDLMKLMGWSPGSRAMLDRYGASVASERAALSYRRLIG